MARNSLSIEALPQTAHNSLSTLGENLLVAIKRRGMKRREVAERALVSEPTLRAVLRGDPAVGIGAYASVLSVLGLEDDIAKVAHPSTDEEGQALSFRHLPQRIKGKPGRYDF